MKKSFSFLLSFVLIFSILFILSSCSEESHSHDMIKINKIPADCQNSGNIEYWLCTGCNKKYTDENCTNEITNTEIPPAHTGGTEIRNKKDSTEQENGYTGDTYCLGCNSKIADGELINKLPHTHSLNKTGSLSATCTNNGNIEYWTCTGCNKFFSDSRASSEIELTDTVIPAEHIGGTEIRDAVNATEHNEGYTGDTYCLGCNSKIKDGDVITKLPHTHNLKKTNASSATCTENGNIEYWSCDGCNRYFSDSSASSEISIETTVITSQGHSMDGYECTECDFDYYTKGLKYEYIGYTASYSVVGIGTATDTDIIIPPSYNNIPVTSIEAAAFENCTTLITVIIPSSIRKIGNAAFSGCTNLEYNVYDNAYYLGNDDNPYLVLVKAKTTDITSCNINANANFIHSMAFYNCEKLTDMEIPKNILSIGESSFCGCTSLKRITLPFVGESRNPENHGIHFGYIFGYTSWTNTYHDWADSCDYNVSSTFYNFHIPYTLETVVITDIDDIAFCAFKRCSYLKHIILPDKLTRINAMAFYSCSSLTEIEIPNSVTYINAGAFEKCSSLESITIPFVGVSADATDRDADFGRIFGVVGSKTEPDSYHYCTYVSNDGYGNKYWVYWTYQIPQNLKRLTITGGNKIGESAFYKCTMLESVYIPSSITTVENNAFSHCISLTEMFLPDSVTSIGRQAFGGCKNLTCITLPFVGAEKDGTSNTHFGYIFDGIPSNLSTVIITGGTKIVENAFSGCSSLVNITLPNTVTSIGKNTFYGCTSLVNITLPFVGTEKDGNVNTHLGYLFGAASYTENSTCVPESLKNVTITVADRIPSHAFDGCINIENITLADTVTNIGEYAFNGCTSLKDITIPVGVIRICMSAFENCISLSNVNFKNGSMLKYIESKAFFNCYAITEMVVPGGVEGIGISAFQGCSGLKSITLPFVGNSLRGSVNTHFGYIFGAETYNDSYYLPYYLRTVIITGSSAIKDNAFYNCQWIESVILPETVTSLGNYAFYGCTKLNKINIPARTAEIGKYAFSYCITLTDIDIPNGVTSIGDGAFNNTALTCINIPTSIAEIAPWVFAHTKLTRIDIPSNVKSIGDYAFYNCENLTSAVLPSGIINIGASAFAYTCLEAIELPYTVTAIGASAFYCCETLDAVFIKNIESWCNISFGNKNANPLYYARELYLEDTPITDLTIPAGITEIKDFAFCGFTNLKTVKIPFGVTSIGDYAFFKCENMASAEIPASITSIGESAFAECSSLEYNRYDNAYYLGNDSEPCVVLMYSVAYDISSCHIHNDTKIINEYSFNFCQNLTHITIPEKVIGIGYKAFDYCTRLLEVCNYSAIDIIAGSEDNGMVAYYALEVHNGESKVVNCNDYLFYTNAGVNYLIDYIGDDSFLILPESYNGEEYKIYDYAFQNSKNLTSITIPIGVMEIGDKAFGGCSKLVEVINHSELDISAGAQDNGLVAYWAIEVHSQESKIIDCNDYLFYTHNGVNYLVGYTGHYTALILPESYNGEEYKIYDYAFQNSKNLTSITIPNTLTAIGSYAFEGCSNLNAVFIDEIEAWCGITFDSSTSNPLYYAKNLYLDNELVTELVIPTGITNINKFAFCNCTSLIKIDLPSCVTDIGVQAFYGCTALTSAILSNELENIGYSAFAHCSSLTTISIPNSVTRIDMWAFSSCTTLANVIIGENSLLSEIGIRAFDSCTTLTSIIIPDSVTKIGALAFSACNNLKIYCEALAIPSDWDPDWNPSCEVVWGYTAN